MANNDASLTSMKIYNVNVGILGHVDSGKTSLVATMSQVLSTAALDKHPQSKERGITLDLGFSSMMISPPPAHLLPAGTETPEGPSMGAGSCDPLRALDASFSALQLTFVDCPGHASLVRTVLGGVQITDLVVLVVDITNGIQAQTAECIIVGEVATGAMVVALNKVDLIPEPQRPKAIARAAKKISRTLRMTRFAGAQIIPVSAGPPAAAEISGDTDQVVPNRPALGIADLVDAICSLVPPPSPSQCPSRTTACAPGSSAGSPLLFAFDHCFQVKGHGTVLTGTVLQGSVVLGDTVELPALRLTRPVKSMQMFRRPVQRAVRGDRVGVCVRNLDPAGVERGLAAAPGSVPTFGWAAARVDKVRFFAGRVPTKSKIHLTVGAHSTLVADLVCIFGLPDGEGLESQEAALAAMATELVRGLRTASGAGGAAVFDQSREYVWQDELYGLEGRPLAESYRRRRRAHIAGLHTALTPPEAAAVDGATASGVPGDSDDNETLGLPPAHWGPQWILFKFPQPVTAPRDAMVIGSRLDMGCGFESRTEPSQRQSQSSDADDASAEADCRFALYGRLVKVFSGPNEGKPMPVGKAPDKSKKTGVNAAHAPQEPPESAAPLSSLRVYKEKLREGSIERLLRREDPSTPNVEVVCQGMFKRDTDLAVFVGLRVTSGLGEDGVIEGAFGKSSKFRVRFPRGLKAPLEGRRTSAMNLTLAAKRYVFGGGGGKGPLVQD